MKFKFNDDKTMFNLDSKAADVRFIKFMDEDYLYSKLTSTDYEELQEAKELKQFSECLTNCKEFIVSDYIYIFLYFI